MASKGNGGKDSARTTREKAAAARAEQLAAEKRRERTVRIIGAAAVLVVVAGIIGLALVASRGDSGGGANPTPAPNPTAPLPKGVFPAGSEYEYGVPFNAQPPNAPVLAVWEDFQCPACGSVEQTTGTKLQEIAASGKAQLIWRPTAFLDSRIKGTNSSRAIAAWGCAIDQDKSAAYHDVVYANQPVEEGTGYTEEQLLKFGTDVGITGAAYDTFASCVQDGTYLPWAANSTEAFYKSEVDGTPAATINGVNQQNSYQLLLDPAALEAALAAAGAPTSSPSPSSSASQ